MRSFLLSACLASFLHGTHAAVPEKMTALYAKAGFLGCKAPDWSCLSVKSVATPKPNKGEVLVQVKGSSINPLNIDFVLLPHLGSVIGTDMAGVVVAKGGGEDCERLKIGDEVWAWGKGAYAEYAIATCKATGLKPTTLSFTEAGILPGVATSALECLQATGAPWANRTNVTVAITSGQGGSGFIGIQLAKALGATTVITAASGDGIAFVKKQGADVVIDYHKSEIFAALEDDSVDIVFDNFGAKGTADRAMPALRSGGVYLVQAGGNGGGTISKHPKAGVTQIKFGMADFTDYNNGLALLKEMFDSQTKRLFPVIQAKYNLTGIKEAFNVIQTGHVRGKLSIVPDMV